MVQGSSKTQAGRRFLSFPSRHNYGSRAGAFSRARAFGGGAGRTTSQKRAGIAKGDGGTCYFKSKERDLRGGPCLARRGDRFCARSTRSVEQAAGHPGPKLNAFRGRTPCGISRTKPGTFFRIYNLRIRGRPIDSQAGPLTKSFADRITNNYDCLSR